MKLKLITFCSPQGLAFTILFRFFVHLCFWRFPCKFIHYKTKQVELWKLRLTLSEISDELSSNRMLGSEPNQCDIRKNIPNFGSQMLEWKWWCLVTLWLKPKQTYRTEKSPKTNKSNIFSVGFPGKSLRNESQILEPHKALH